MHGLRVIFDGKPRKACLVSLFDDASRGRPQRVLHGRDGARHCGRAQASLLNRGQPIKLAVDNHHLREDRHGIQPGTRFEVPYEFTGKTVQLLVNSHAGVVAGVEDVTGAALGLASRLFAHVNTPFGANPDAGCTASARQTQSGRDGELRHEGKL